MLKDEVSKANKRLVELGLAKLGFGNVSTREGGFVWIKPSGKSEGAVKVDLNGFIFDSKLKPSVDTPTHLMLYRAWKEIRAIVHTHSTYATAFAQLGVDIYCNGTTHADFFKGNIPCIDFLNKKKMDYYEQNIGIEIVEYFKRNKINQLDIPGCLIRGHGVFVWGKDIDEAMKNTEAIEEIAKIYSIHHGYYHSPHLPKHYIEKHFNRKHGKGDYYGQ